MLLLKLLHKMHQLQRQHQLQKKHLLKRLQKKPHKLK
jgi:hypothetical protein